VISRKVLLVLVTSAAILPMAIAVVVAVARLLSAMQDAAGSAVLDRVALALGILWALNLIALVMSLALERLGPPGE
jgi:hypothetical protein